MSELPRQQYFRLPSGLLLPHTSAARPEHALPQLKFMLTTVSHEELGTSRPTLGAIIDTLRRYSLREVATVVSRIQLGLFSWTRDHGHSDAQDRILRRVFHADVAQALRAKVVSALAAKKYDAAPIFFHSRQLLALLKLAFLSIDPCAPSRQAHPEQLVHALLQMNDIIDERAAGLDTATEDGQLALQLYFFANAYFNRGGSRTHRLARACQLFVEHKAHLASHPQYLDVPERLQLVTGLPAQVLWSVLFTLSAGWLSQAARFADDDNIARSKSAYLSTLTGLSASEREDWFALAASDVLTLQQRVRSLYTLNDPEFFDLLPFEQFPLVSFGDTVLCISPDYLDLLAGPSIEHRCLSHTLSTAERRRFLDFRGFLFQDYIDTLLLREFGARVHSEATLAPLMQGKKCCDGIIEYGDACILYECKANMLSLGMRTGSRYNEYRENIARLVTAAADQMASTAQALRAGAFAALQLLPDRIKRVYPLLITWDFAVTDLTYDVFVTRGLSGRSLHGLEQEGFAAPMQVMDVDEVEALHKAVDLPTTLAEQLRHKASDWALRRMAFNQYWHLHHPEVLQSTHPDLQETLRRAVERTTNYMRSRGLAG